MSSEFQNANATIWSQTSMLLDNCEQAVAQLRTVRELLEHDTAEGETRTAPALKRKPESSEPPPLPAHPSIRYTRLHRYGNTGQEAVKRVKVLSPQERAEQRRTEQACSTPLKHTRRPTAPLADPFQSPELRARPQVVISSESD